MLEADAIERLPALMRPGAGRGMRGDPIARLRSFDANGDGRITREEIPDQAGGMFDRVDANGDDVITADELDAMAGRMPGRPGR